LYYNVLKIINSFNYFETRLIKFYCEKLQFFFFIIIIDEACPITRKCYYMLRYTTIYTLQLLHCRFYSLSKSIEFANLTNCVRCELQFLCKFLSDYILDSPHLSKCFYFYFRFMTHPVDVVLQYGIQFYSSGKFSD
jgi:hypothetical protein